MAANHEHKQSLELSLEADDAYIQRRADQGVSTVYGGELALYGEGRDQNPNHPVVIRETAPDDSETRRHRKPSGVSRPQEDEPEFRVPTFHVRTEAEHAENQAGLEETRQSVRAERLGRAVLTGDQIEAQHQAHLEDVRRRADAELNRPA